MNKKKTLEEKVMCLNQFIRPTIYIPMEGVGDCRICQPSKDNKYCKHYYPIPVRTFYVKDDYKNE